MITSPAFRGKRYAVLGLARSGLATVDALLASGADVTAWDNREEAQALVAGRVTLADPVEMDLAGFDAVILTPGLPLNRHPIAALAKAADVPVIGDIELFAQARVSLPPHKVVGITGTNGKSTTTALITHILETAGMPVLMGGNIGLPILSRDPLSAGGVYVLELSSYQIDLTQSLDCDVAILTNITPDHLDRYSGLEGYAASKAHLFEMQSSRQDAFVDNSAFVKFGSLFANAGAPLQMLDSIFPLAGQEHWPSLQGPHNAQNAKIAIEACKALDLTDEAIEQGLRSYPGLPHRMERVAERNSVLFVNDSKATNATATAPALAAYPVIHWILGGLPKTEDLDDCVPHFSHVKAGYTIGQAGAMFADILRNAGKSVTESGTLERAVQDAAAVAEPGEVVLLSPACASFDQFKDYEARGDAFRAAVGALA